MSRITEYTAVDQFDAGDVLLKDGTGGTKTITAENAANEFKRLAGISNDISNAINPVVESVNTIASGLSETEDTFVASKDYNIGDIFSVSNTIYKATATITAGSDILPDTNCEAITVGDELMDVRNALNTKANTDGYYQSMTVGNAEQLVSSRYTVDNEPYLYRTSGGTADIGDREYDEIVGGSVVWNQLVRSNLVDKEITQGISRTASEDRSKLTYSGTATQTDNYTAASFNLNAIGHKVLVSLGNVNLPSGTKVFNSVNDKSTEAITTITGIALQVSVYILSGTEVDFTVTPQAFDLTQMFGTEIADYVYNLEQTTPGAGVAWFRKYFPKDYYEYNAGELKHVEGLSAHEMVGFNLWNEEWEAGYYDSKGTLKTATNQICTRNKIKVLPNTTYYLKIPVTANNTVNICEYDGNDALLNRVDVVVSNGASGATYTTSASCHYININFGIYYGSTYNHDININLSWSGWRDGEYEPYTKHSYPLDSSLTLRGVPKLSSDGKLYFDGDRYASDGTVTRRYGLVDLGTLEWAQHGGVDGRWTATLPNVAKATADYSIKGNAVCSKYENITQNKLFAKTQGIAMHSLTGTVVYVYDQAYTDATSFKAAMSGVWLLYELAEPTTETALAYQSPQIVDDFGTEEYVSTGIVPVGHETKYLANLRDKIQHLPDLADNDGYYVIQQTDHDMSLVNFRIPQAPTTDGTYTLKATVTGGTPTYTWENEQEVNTNEG